MYFGWMNHKSWAHDIRRVFFSQPDQLPRRKFCRESGSGKQPQVVYGCESSISQNTNIEKINEGLSPTFKFMISRWSSIEAIYTTARLAIAIMPSSYYYRDPIQGVSDACRTIPISDSLVLRKNTFNTLTSSLVTHKCVPIYLLFLPSLPPISWVIMSTRRPHYWQKIGRSEWPRYHGFSSA